jgi:hypothetical protein
MCIGVEPTMTEGGVRCGGALFVEKQNSQAARYGGVSCGFFNAQRIGKFLLEHCPCLKCALIVMLSTELSP